MWKRGGHQHRNVVTFLVFCWMAEGRDDLLLHQQFPLSHILSEGGVAVTET